MEKSPLRLAAASMTTAAMLLTPVAASAQSANEQPISHITEHTAMASHHKSGSSGVPGTIVAASQPSMVGMSMTGTNAMANKMHGHATMADAMRAHPELEKMCRAMMAPSSAMMNKMRGHATMADAMRAHPELEKLCKAMISMTGTNAMANKMHGHATMTDAMRAHPERTSMS